MSELSDRILTTDTGRKMLEQVSPIYENSYIGLWMLEVIGREYENLWELVRTLPAQLFPETADWGLELWEKRYGLDGAGLTLEERRAQLRLKRAYDGPLTPKRIEDLAESMTGLKARVVEHVGPYTFAVYLLAATSSEDKLREMINRVKPAHLSFEIRYELGVTGTEILAGVVSTGKRYTLMQVN